MTAHNAHLLEPHIAMPLPDSTGPTIHPWILGDGKGTRATHQLHTRDGDFVLPGYHCMRCDARFFAWDDADADDFHPHCPDES